MPKMTQLYNQHIAVEKGQEIDAQNSDENGPVVIEIWTMIFTDKSYGDQLRVGFPQGGTRRHRQATDGRHRPPGDAWALTSDGLSSFTHSHER